MSNNNKKGKSGERALAKLLNERFKVYTQTLGCFARTIGSGNRWSQTACLSKEATESLAGDLITPKTFKYCIENKCGYKSISIHDIFAGSKQLDNFLFQAITDAQRIDKLPVLIWKSDYKPYIAAVKQSIDSKISISYNSWYIYSLNDWLSQSDSIFFAN